MSDSGTFLYVSQHGGGQISVLRLSPETGDLTRVQDMPAGGSPMPMAVSPDQRFLHAALRDDGLWQIASFAIDQGNGRLTALGTVPAIESATYISSDRTGRFLFAAYNSHRAHRTGMLGINAVGAHGWVQEPYEIVRTPPKMHAVIPDAANRFVLATSCDGDSILRYAFDALTGALDPLPPVSVEPGRGPRHLTFHPNNRFLYVVNEYDASVVVYRYDAHVAGLSEIQIASASPPGYTPADRRGRGPSAAAADIHLTPDGRWLYVSVRGSLTMAVFAVDPTSGLLCATGAHVTMPNEPRGFAIDPFGRYLIVAGFFTSSVVIFRIDPATGGLEQTAEYPLGEGPNWVECLRLR